MDISGVALKEEGNILVGKAIPLPLCPPQLPHEANFGFGSERPVIYSVRGRTTYTQLHSWFKKHTVTVTPYVYTLLIKYVITFY